MCFELVGWQVAKRFQHAVRVKPVHPFECGKVIGTIAWLLRAIFTRFLELQTARATIDLEQKSTLAIDEVRRESQRQIESAKHALSLRLERQKSRFTRLQDERVGPLLKLFSAISEVTSTTEHLQLVLRISPEEDFTDDLKEIDDQLQAARDAYFQSLLFLPEPIADLIEKLLDDIRGAEQGHYLARTYQSASIEDANAELAKSLQTKFSAQTREFAGPYCL